MQPILLRGKSIESVFELVGKDENSLTFAFGWCLSQASAFLEIVVAELGGPVPSVQASVLLQEHGGKHGFTDVEVVDPGRATYIFEAKLGFYPPALGQLAKYAQRLHAVDTAAKRFLVVIAQADRRELWLKQSIPSEVQGIPVKVLSWGQIRSCAKQAYPNSNNTGKAILRQFNAYLAKVLQMQTVNSNEVFVVSVSRSTFGGGTTSFIDVVAKHQRYFHPVGPRWPPNPPNYIAFRWDGRLQSIHHVDRYEIITSWRPHFPDTTEKEIAPHFLYHLGPPIVPPHEVKTGNIFRSGRVWAAIDLLLTCKSISEAWDKSNERTREAAGAP